LESEDKKLISLIGKSEDIVQMIKAIAEKQVESDDEGEEEGEGEVIQLAQRSLQLLGQVVKPPHIEG
jgi:vacuolar protein 8